MTKKQIKGLANQKHATFQLHTYSAYVHTYIKIALHPEVNRHTKIKHKAKPYSIPASLLWGKSLPQVKYHAAEQEPH